jgi:murein tripeptide amidase MpaA
MPGYLTAVGIEAALGSLANQYPALVTLISLPERSVQGRTCHAVKIAHGSSATRRGVLFIGGLHARELVNPDLLISLSFDICDAYTNNTGLTYGGKTYDAATVQLIVNVLDLFIFPLVNPDGRVSVQSGNTMWRKNMNPNPGAPCKGVDLNRNFDFLWASGIGTSAQSCAEIYKGSSAFSEPETRNVRSLITAYPQIGWMVDVHSYSERIMYPWGDDESQSSNKLMNFANPAYDGKRGIVGDALYKEYVPSGDAQWFASIGAKVRAAIAAVRGRSYTVGPSVGLYPTSGTSDDYGYARSITAAAKQRLCAFCIETGTEFQPQPAEAANIIKEVSAGLLEFCLASICVLETVTAGTAAAKELDKLRTFRDQQMKTGAGKKYAEMLMTHSGELMRLVSADPQLGEQALDVLKMVSAVIPATSAEKPATVDAALLGAVEALLQKTKGRASAPLGEAIKELSKDLGFFKNKTVAQGLKAASKGGG